MRNVIQVVFLSFFLGSTVLLFQNCSEVDTTKDHSIPLGSKISNATATAGEPLCGGENFDLSNVPETHIGSIGCQVDLEAAQKNGFLIRGMRVGTHPLPVSDPLNSLAVVFNDTGKFLQLDQVSALPKYDGSWEQYKSNWGEFALHLDEIFLYKNSNTENQICRPGQKMAGIGEVGTVFKEATEWYFQTMTWKGSNTPYGGILVPPNSCFIVGGQNYYPPTATEENPNQIPEFRGFDFYYKASEVREGLISIRQPKLDAGFNCGGGITESPLEPWQNKTGKVFVLSGAQIYATGPGNSSGFEDGCLTIYEAGTSAVVSRYCGLTQKGQVDFPNYRVQPNQWVSVVGRHTCRPEWNGMTWGYAAYLQGYLLE